MILEVAFVSELVGPNYLAWKRKMIDVLRSKNLWRIVNDEHKNLLMLKMWLYGKPVDAFF